jgi:DNA-binding transcriptional regulator of glucitol operon
MGELSKIFLVLLVLVALQSVGGLIQIRDYRNAVHRVRQLGNLGVGQQRRLLGKLVLIACDSSGIVTGAEVMEGFSIFARFRPKKEAFGHTLKGSHILDLLADLRALEPKRRKRQKGYLQALEALEMRLYPAPEAEEA